MSDLEVESFGTLVTKRPAEGSSTCGGGVLYPGLAEDA